MRHLILLSILYLSLTCNAQKAMYDNSVIPYLDLNRYLGTWYEIARFDHKFERDLVGVTAKYSIRKDGKIKVLNSGFKGTLEGPYSEAIGKAKMPNPKESGKLKVSFFLFFYADYYVMELDDKYQWAVIGSSNPNYLWILSRTPKIDDLLYENILILIDKRGYDISKLIEVIQPKL